MVGQKKRSKRKHVTKRLIMLQAVPAAQATQVTLIELRNILHMISMKPMDQ
jgi:hypothetical protein